MIQGNPDESSVNNMTGQLKQMFDEWYKQAQEKEYQKRAMQKGYT